MLRVVGRTVSGSASIGSPRAGPSPSRAVFAFAARVLASAMLLVAHTAVGASAQTNAELRDLVEGHLRPWLADGTGAAVVVRDRGRTAFLDFGFADRETGRRVSPDAIFNLASVGKLFAATLLAQAVERGELRLDDPVAKYVTELQRGGDIRRVTLRQLASHSSGLTRGPGEYEPWHRGKYTLPDFIRYLNAWRADPGHEPGQQNIYSNGGLVLLRLALERRFGMPFASLMESRILKPLAMSSTALPLPAALKRRAVQGYGPAGRPIGQPGEQQGILDFRSAGQIYSSARDMAAFLAANLGDLPNQGPLEQAMKRAQQPVFGVGPRFTQALVWQRVRNDGVTIVDKNGGLNNTSTYIGMIPEKGLGIVILCNRGKVPATRLGREILLTLASARGPAIDEGGDPD
jgi:beta-lactamase class C